MKMISRSAKALVSRTLSCCNLAKHDLMMAVQDQVWMEATPQSVTLGDVSVQYNSTVVHRLYRQHCHCFVTGYSNTAQLSSAYLLSNHHQLLPTHPAPAIYLTANIGILSHCHMATTSHPTMTNEYFISSWSMQIYLETQNQIHTPPSLSFSNLLCQIET